MAKTTSSRYRMQDDHNNSINNNSSTLLKLDKELTNVKAENKRLKIQLLEKGSMLEQILNETKHEKFDERRINLLKCQIIQLERQTMLLTEALGERSHSLMEVENALSWITNELRLYISADVRGSNVAVSRASLMAMVETGESARIKLFKGIENNSKENLAKSSMFVSDFIKKKHHDDLTLVDIASGQTKHLNLKHVGQLESKLSLLYKELISLQESLPISDQNTADKLASGHMISGMKERLSGNIIKTSAMCKDCSSDLLHLSLIYPSAPWSALRRSIVKDITVEKFMSLLPNLPKLKTVEVHQRIEGLIKVSNYRHTMMEKEVKALREEVQFHQNIYHHQLSYIESLFTAVKDGYMSFEQSVHDVVVQPLKETLRNYENLKTEASENALRDFLSSIKRNEAKLQCVVDKLELIPDESKSQQVMSSFGEEFFQILNTLVIEQQTKRDEEWRCRREMKEEQEQMENELRHLMESLEQKKICAKQSKDLLELSSESSACDINMLNNTEIALRKDGLLDDRESKNSSSSEKSAIETSHLLKNDAQLKNEKPPLGKDRPSPSRTFAKQTRGYEPNLVVPNRILQLRRSNSISKLNCDKNERLNENGISNNKKSFQKSTEDCKTFSVSLSPLKNNKKSF